MPGEKAGRTDFQNQSIAYSLDEGKTWIKYAGNPVLKTPGLKDFRDPKVIWHAPTKKWIMSLAVADHVEFYSAPDLIHWTKESEIGKGQFAHGGVWECPDLLHFNVQGKTIWVLLVSMNPGGPNGGSATQYIVGDFDGHTFKPFTEAIKWMDYGPDNYAGLPGAILEVDTDNGSNVIMATEVSTKFPKKELVQPTKGDKMNRAQFQDAMKKIMEDMQRGGGMGGIRISRGGN